MPDRGRQLVAPSAIRRLIEVGVLAICFLLVLRQWGAEPYQVPTGSMAPTLAGHHRAKDCPRCGYHVTVGRHDFDKGTGPAPFRCYRGSFCPNCGFAQLDMHQAPVWSGDHLLVNKSVFALRRPRRWEIIVFRLLGMIFVKRLVGLPDELLEIIDGDIYVNGELQR
ncbi:MAG TPA: S26 family signal peptidase, partial [Gemmataceae bacterium]|nr:S26 family signal peptidase [Gemmataceae bacterium]